MKKLFFLMTVLLLSVCFVSCSKDDDDNDSGALATQLIANWRITDSKFAEKDSYATWRLEDTGAIFMEGGDYFGYGYFGYGTGKWSLSGKTVTCSVNNKPFAYYEVLSVSGNTCELKMSVPGSDTKLWIRCKKIGE